jgi:hypothetical protein
VRAKIWIAKIAEKIWREKAPSLKDALVYGKKDPRVDAYIAKSADFAKSIHATVTTHECAVWVSLKPRNPQLKARRNHRDLAAPDFIDRNLRPSYSPQSDRLNQELVNN